MKNFPSIVFKYRNWDNAFHKNILLHNELYLASPKDFNDPFDCRIPPNFNLLTDEEKNKYLNELLVKHYQEALDLGIDLNRAIPDLERKISISSLAQKEIEALEI